MARHGLTTEQAPGRDLKQAPVGWGGGGARLVKEQPRARRCSSCGHALNKNDTRPRGAAPALPWGRLLERQLQERLEFLKSAIAEHDGCVTAAAETIGYSRTLLYRQYPEVAQKPRKQQ